MTAPSFLCALDLIDSIAVSTRWASVQIYGWIIASDGAVQIDEVWIECAGKLYPTSFPQPRPDVGSHYPSLENSAQSGFATGDIPLQRSDESIDIRVIAKCKCVEHLALTRRVRLVWFDPEHELFSLGRIGPFRFPEDIDESRLASYPDCAPVFLAGTRSATSQVPGLADGGLFLDLMNAVVACHDVYIEYRRKYFAHIDDQIRNYAVGTFNVYAILNKIIAAVHARVLADAAGTRPAYRLTGKRQLTLVPLIGAMYPRAEFVHLRQRAVSCGIGTGASWYAVTPRSVFDYKANYSPYEDPGTRGRSFGHLLRTLVRTGRYSIREVDWPAASGEDVESLLSRLGMAQRSSTAKRESVRATQPADASQKPPEHLLVVSEFAEASPVFVLGAGRSGTSAMVGALNAAGIGGFSEGHLFPMLNEMTERLWRRYGSIGTAHRGPHVAAVRTRIMETVLRTAVENAYGAYGGRPWVDKTADHPMIECIPLLRMLFPRARYLMMIRHPVSFAESRRRKFGEAVVSAVSEWARSLETWDAHKHSLPPSRYLEVDLTRLNDSASVQALCAFLGLGDAQRKNFTDYLASERPELTRVPPELAEALKGLDPERAYELRSMFYTMLNSLGEYAESAGWDGETAKAVDEMLGTLAERHGYQVHMPKHHLESLLLQWAKTLEEYRYTAEYHEKNAAYWANIAKNSKIVAGR
jgi:sulfotransferase family protein